jgi:hypothetical protein
MRADQPHLNGYGKPCCCTTERDCKQAEPAPIIEPKKVLRVPTWADAETREAERRGLPVWMRSRDWGKDHEDSKYNR